MRFADGFWEGRERSFLDFLARPIPTNAALREKGNKRHLWFASGVELWDRLSRRPSKLPGFPKFAARRPRAPPGGDRPQNRTFGRDSPDGNGQSRGTGKPLTSTRLAVSNSRRARGKEQHRMRLNAAVWRQERSEEPPPTLCSPGPVQSQLWFQVCNVRQGF